MRVWVTRAQPGADATAARLTALGHRPLTAPLLVVRALAGASLDLSGVGALAFTSANAVPAFAALSRVRDLPVFAVGEATAAAARAAGFARVESADGDVAALAALIADRRGFEGAVLHPSAREPAGDLVGDLAAAGVPARAAPVYATVAADVLPAAVADALAADDVDAVLVHSPRAGRALAGLLSPVQAARLAAFALSPACAAPLSGAGFARISVAPFPNEAAMLKLMGS